MTYKISVKANEDLENIWLYTLETWSVAQAHYYVDLILDEIECLANNPTIGKDYGHIRKGYRYAKVKSHLIFYRIAETSSGIEVIRVLHQRMDIENRLGD
jgi:toxin ParE1/3/4